MKLIVGLGNPGRKYEKTRHNVGFEVIGELAQRYFIGRAKSKFHGELAEILIKDQKVLLLCPLTFMNASGKSVRDAVEFYKLSPSDLIVVCDDLNLKTGRIRIKPSGSAGGQNGVKDIILRLGHQDFPRLRIGINRPPPDWDTSNFVLGKFDEEDRIVVDRAIKRAADAIEAWIDVGIEKAMSQFNSEPESNKKQRKNSDNPDSRKSESGATDPGAR